MHVLHSHISRVSYCYLCIIINYFVCVFQSSCCRRGRRTREGNIKGPGVDTPSTEDSISHTQYHSFTPLTAAPEASARYREPPRYHSKCSPSYSHSQTSGFLQNFLINLDMFFVCSIAWDIWKLWSKVAQMVFVVCSLKKHHFGKAVLPETLKSTPVPMN